jgi:hypothetical protein
VLEDVLLHCHWEDGKKLEDTRDEGSLDLCDDLDDL